MSERMHILHALSEVCDPDLLVEPIAEQFPEVSQNLAGSDDLIPELRSKPYSILFLDSFFPSQHGIGDLCQAIKQQFGGLIIVMIIPDHSPEHVKIALDNSVFYYLTHPIKAAEVTFCVNHCRALARLRSLSDGQARRKNARSLPGFIGRSRPMRSLFEMIERVADDDLSTVLIRGESGTGKELVAKAIHALSNRASHHFVPVNCAAIPDELLESELFGHLKGSFTGAGQNKTGRIQYADKGTLFLDEIGDMKPNLQAKLLRVIQEREFEPVGSLKAIPVDTRIVAATHCDLEDLVQQGNFREDLYYRLSVIPIEVPPLRERAEDITLLLDEFIDRYTIRRGRDRIVFSPESVEALLGYDWRGNVRELENLVQHMSILYGGKRIHPHHLPAKFCTASDNKAGLSLEADQASLGSTHDVQDERTALFGPASPPRPAVNFENGPVNFNELINEFENELIVAALKFTAGNKKEASRMLCLKRTTLLEKIKKKEIEGTWLPETEAS